MNRRRALAGLAAAALAPPFPAHARQGSVLPWDDITPLPVGTRARFTDLSGITGDTVPNDEFFVLHHGIPPPNRGVRFRLRIGRRGEPPTRELSTADLAQISRTQQVVAFECCGNGGIGMHGLVGAAGWGGVRLAPLLDGLIGPDDREVVFFGADRAEERLRRNRYPARFARSLPVTDALGPDVMLADTMNGAPLPREHGGPLRLIVPGFYGVSQVKWVERIEVWPSRFAGWFQAKDYVTVRGVETPSGVVHEASAIGRMRLKSLVTRVEASSDAGLLIRGLAWNDARSPVESVEVRVDDGPWRRADLAPSEPRYGLLHFSLPWPAPTSGAHTLISRARDARGLQPTEAEASHRKATPWENNGQVLRRIRL